MTDGQQDQDQATCEFPERIYSIIDNCALQMKLLVQYLALCISRSKQGDQ